MIIRDIDIAEALEDTELAYYVINQLNALPFNDTEVDLSELQEFLKTEAVSNEIGNVFRLYTRALGTNDLEFHLTTDNIIDIVQNLEPEFNDLFNHRMTEADNIILARTLDDVLDFEGLTVSGIMYDVGIDTIVPRLLFSPYVMFGVIILIMLTLCSIFLLNLKTIPNAFLQSGITVTLSGFVYLITGVIFSTYPDLLSGPLHTLSGLVGGMMHLVIRTGIVLLAVGVISIVVWLFIRNRNK